MEGQKKILVIMGSPHKGNTYRECEKLHDLMTGEIPVEFEYLWLKDANLLPCKGCLLCFSSGEKTCPNHDDAPLIEQKMREADGVIFATPVYGMNVTGQMKIFIDRFCYIFHRPRFFEKRALLLATTGALGHVEVLKYLDKVARVWGFEIAGAVGLVTPVPLPSHHAEKNQTAIVKMAKQFADALKRPVRKSPGLKDMIIFHGQRAVFSQVEKLSPADYQYWKENGWFEKGVKYFIDVPVHPVYHGIGIVVEWLAKRQVKKEFFVNSE